MVLCVEAVETEKCRRLESEPGKGSASEHEMQCSWFQTQDRNSRPNQGDGPQLVIWTFEFQEEGILNLALTFYVSESSFGSVYHFPFSTYDKAKEQEMHHFLPHGNGV